MNKLEEAMSNMNNIQDNIDTLIFAIGDSPRKYTEDQLLNMLMGMSELHQTLYDKLWMEYESLKKKHGIGEHPIVASLYGDGTLKREQ